jgi:hypothetical protein
MIKSLRLAAMPAILVLALPMRMNLFDPDQIWKKMNPDNLTSR